MRNRLGWALAAGLLALVPSVMAENIPAEPTDSEKQASEETERLTAYEACLIRLTQSASNILSAGNVRNFCAREVRQQGLPAGTRETPLQERREMERLVLNNPFSLLPHRPNYLMPLNYSDFRDDSYLAPGEGDLQPVEIQFQLSLKVIVVDGLIGRHGNLAFAYTGKSFWQAYNFDLSSPFRETNHEPELIVTFENDTQFLGFRNVSNSVGLNHESNGRSGEDSRSWNRVVFQTQWERERMHVALRPWLRIPAPEERYEGDPLGDDNPDILEYLGHFDLTVGYVGEYNSFWLTGRNNLDLDHNRGAIDAGWTFPLSDHVRGRVHYFDGFGESLIDYNKRSRTIGLGFQFSGWL
ncbi:phospholipase A [Saccharospirillum mangrovi]|uniref:phospholipase A n=1 Tax=Saccharospirillum mangrovi TaxID=2161747 RepID=UPI000D37D00F|nr:phospholipase A [Saccharospirillum mangrovi]